MCKCKVRVRGSKPITEFDKWLFATGDEINGLGFETTPKSWISSNGLDFEFTPKSWIALIYIGIIIRGKLVRIYSELISR